MSSQSERERKQAYREHSGTNLQNQPLGTNLYNHRLIEQNGTNQQIRAVTLDEYVSLPRPGVYWIVDKLIPKPSFILLIGQEKIGKSFLALDIGHKIANGLPLLGFEQQQSHKVLYLQFDTSEAIWRQRLQDLKAGGYDLKSHNFIMPHPEDMLSPFDILSNRGQKWLKELKESHKPDVVIIDVLREIHTRDENDSKEMKLVGDAITTLLGDITTIMVHHTRKLSTDYVGSAPGQMARGSSYISGKVDAFWYLQANKLVITNRFSETLTFTSQRQKSGLWTFIDSHGVKV